MYMRAVCLRADTIRIQLWVSRGTTGGTGTQTQVCGSWKPLLCLTLKSLPESRWEQGEVSIWAGRHLKDVTEVY